MSIGYLELQSYSSEMIAGMGIVIVIDVPGFVSAGQ